MVEPTFAAWPFTMQWASAPPVRITIDAVAVVGEQVAAEDLVLRGRDIIGLRDRRIRRGGDGNRVVGQVAVGVPSLTFQVIVRLSPGHRWSISKPA
jgi:hypothetical protein